MPAPIDEPATAIAAPMNAPDVSAADDDSNKREHDQAGGAEAPRSDVRTPVKQDAGAHTASGGDDQTDESDDDGSRHGVKPPRCRDARDGSGAPPRRKR